METAILQCLQQFSSKNSKIAVYHDQRFKKRLKLHVPLQNCAKARVVLAFLNNTLVMINCYFAVFAAVFQ